MKKLVAYFSASGTTEKLAKTLAEVSGADLFEIRPEKPYSDGDLKWMNPVARCNREKFGKKDVPVIGRVENFAEYGLIILGFPIWYGCAPNVVNTFVKGYNWTGKKLALFATSGGSAMGKTAEKLKPHLNGAPEIIAERLFRASDSAEELMRWVDSLPV